MSKCFILSTPSSAYFADAIDDKYAIDGKIEIERSQFSNGERYYRLKIKDEMELAESNVIYVGSTHDDESLLELYRVGSKLANLGVKRIIFVIPFFGYSTMERVSEPGEVVTAKSSARLLSAIPQARLGNTFLLLDPHSETLPHYFKGDSVRFSLQAEPILFENVKRLVEEKQMADIVIGSADLGRPKVIRNLAAFLQAETAFVNKERKREKTHVISVVGDVVGCDVIIYDDMVRNGGTLIDAAKAYMAKGARRVFAVVSHLSFSSPDVITNIECCSPIEVLVGTNSHPMSQDVLVERSRKIHVVDVSPVFAESIDHLL